MKILKILLIVFVFLLVIGAVALFIFLKTFDINRYKPQILTVMNSALGRSMDFENLTLQFSLNSIIYQQKPEGFVPKFEVVGCFLEYDGKILLLHRQDHTSQGNTWGIPGGKLEKGETYIQAAIRETKEETGLDISDPTHCDMVHIEYPAYKYNYYMVKYVFKDVKPDFLASVRINSKEHKGFTWVTPKDALGMNLMLDEDPCIRMVYPCEEPNKIEPMLPAVLPIQKQ